VTDTGSLVDATELSRAPTPVIGAARDAVAVTIRNLTDLWRVPQFLVFIMLQPILFVLLFRYVFGGAISTVPGIPYVDYLMPGIFVITVVFGSATTAVSMATDAKSGLLERFRALPMARSAVLAGRTLSDLLRTTVIVAIIIGIGFAVGFRVQTNAFLFIAAILLVLLFAYALLWIQATVGLLTGDPESAQAASFPVVALFTFASSAFVPISTMPAWLQGFAKYQPVSVMASAVRALCLGGATASWVLQALAWILVILVVFIPLAVWRYSRSE
jgi:ABC-2 type transport system permease protein/oleandomycin transport system permease protein